MSIRSEPHGFPELRDHRAAVAEQRRREHAETRRWAALGMLNLFALNAALVVFYALS